MLAGVAVGALGPAVVGAQPTIRRLGIFSLLGNSVRVVARNLEEPMFKDVGMDEIVFATAQTLVLERHAQAQIRLFRAPDQISVDEQLQIGNAAGRRGELPDWIVQAARRAELSHVLLVNSHTGAMEFRTGSSQVVGSNQITGIGFYVGADGRVTNQQTGTVSTGYLAPFVQLRVTLLDAASRAVIHSTGVGEGYIVGPPENEAPDPWRYLDRIGKAQALQQLLKLTLGRGVEAVLKAT